MNLSLKWMRFFAKKVERPIGWPCTRCGQLLLEDMGDDVHWEDTPDGGRLGGHHAVVCPTWLPITWPWFELQKPCHKFLVSYGIRYWQYDLEEKTIVPGAVVYLTDGREATFLRLDAKKDDGLVQLRAAPFDIFWVPMQYLSLIKPKPLR